MASLTITVGISGSGKSTWAKSWVAENPSQRCRVNRDDLRVMLYTAASYTPEEEEGVDAIIKPIVAGLLEKDRDVVLDNTHLHILSLKEWQDFAIEHDVPFNIRFFAIDPDEAKARVRSRADAGGLDVVESFIDAQHEKYEKLMHILNDITGKNDVL